MFRDVKGAVTATRRDRHPCRSFPTSCCGTWWVGTWRWPCWPRWLRSFRGNWEKRPTLRLGSRGDPPEWYFLFMFQTLKLLPARIGPFEGEVVGVLFFGVCGLVVLLTPFLDRGRTSRMILNGLAAVAVAFFIVMTAWGWFPKAERNRVADRPRCPADGDRVVLTHSLDQSENRCPPDGVRALVAGGVGLVDRSLLGSVGMTSLAKQFVATVLLLVALGSAWSAQPSWGQQAVEPTTDLPADYSCIVCHRQGGDLWTETTPIVDDKALAGDIHWQKGLRCHDCHGGSPTLELIQESS